MPLVFVPTPLGNLRDITLRALDVLRSCDLLVAEDSRVARKLLNALDLPSKEIWSYHEHNARSAAPAILERAREQTVAVVADAGMPGISDPGCDLVVQARRDGIAVEVLPGPSAALGVAVLSGFDLRRFVFEGFPPRTSSARRRALEASFSLGMPSIWYESPQRIIALLADIAAVDANAQVFLAREYTKRFEQQIAGTAAHVSSQLAVPVRGEIALAVMPSAREAPIPAQEHVDGEIDAALDRGESVSAIAKALTERGLGERRHLYAKVTQRKRERQEAAQPGR